jgi:hypothetical protein
MSEWRSARAQVAQARISPEKQDSYRGMFGAFARWCQAYGLDELNADEDIVLAYLELAGQGWGAAHRSLVTCAINWSYRSHGLPTPIGRHVSQYLAARQRAYGRGLHDPVHALSVDDVLQMTTAASAVDSDDRLARASFALLRAAAQAGLTWTRPGRTWRRLLDDVRLDAVRPDAVVLTLDSASLTCSVEISTDPLGYAALTEIANEHGWRPGEQMPGCHQLDVRHLLSTWRRVHHLRAGRPTVTDSATLLMWTDRQWWWHQRLIPRQAVRQVRDVAWLLVSWTHATRFRNLHDAELVRELDDGAFVLRTVHHKGGMDGAAPLYWSVEHLPDCGLLCPACALCDQLEWLALKNVDPEFGLFPTHYGEAWGPMTRQNAVLQLRRLWLDSGGDPNVQVTTRSLRSGAAVTAAERGATIQEIADLLRHKDPKTSRHYLRARRPELVEVRLNYSLRL